MTDPKFTVLGETTVLECHGSGMPTPKRTWMKDDEPLKITKRHFLTGQDQLLIIVETEVSDGGVYKCEMTNTVGTVSDTSELKILSKNGETIINEGEGNKDGGLDDESTTTGIIIIAVVCCVVGTSLVWVIIIYQTRKRHEEYSTTPTDETTLPGELGSSSYNSSSDKEGSLSTGPVLVSGYHYPGKL